MSPQTPPILQDPTYVRPSFQCPKRPPLRFSAEPKTASSGNSWSAKPCVSWLFILIPSLIRNKGNQEIPVPQLLGFNWNTCDSWLKCLRPTSFSSSFSPFPGSRETLQSQKFSASSISRVRPENPNLQRQNALSFQTFVCHNIRSKIYTLTVAAAKEVLPPMNHVENKIWQKKNWKWWICLVTFLYVTSKWFIMFLFHVSKHNSTIIFIAEISGFGRLACFVAVFSLLDVWFRRPKPSRKLESLLWYHRGCEKSGWIPPCQIPGINKLILGKIPNYKLLRGRSCHACLLMRLCDTVCVCVHLTL